MKYKLIAEVEIIGRAFINLKNESDLAKIYKYYDKDGTYFAIVFKDIATWAYDDSSLFNPEWGDCIRFCDKKELFLEDFIKFYDGTDEVYTHDDGDGSGVTIKIPMGKINKIIKQYEKLE